MGNVCLGILNGSEVGMGDLNLIGGRNIVTISFLLMLFLDNGYCHLYCYSSPVKYFHQNSFMISTLKGRRLVYADISMLDKVMVFDNEKQLIGWAPADCDRVPKSRHVSI